MDDWMRTLADHYTAARRRWPTDDLVIVFDIDGTILDMRHMVAHVLLAYDRAHGTGHFRGLRVDDVDVHENNVEALLRRRGLREPVTNLVLDWYREHRWSSEAILAAHRPFQGVMDIIRWFQLQPRTFVGLNTGRPAAIRRDTLASLNAIGREYRVQFADHLLHMNPGTWEQGVQDVKARALLDFRAQGFRVVAAVDNEPSNLAAMARADDAGEVLFLHAETLFESSHRELPRTVAGSRYDITGLLREQDVPHRVQLVWQAVDDRASLEAFLGSTIQWAECNVRRDPLGRAVLRAESFAARPWHRDEQELPLDEALHLLARADKGVVTALEDAELFDDVAAAAAGFPPERLCFHGSIEQLGEGGFRHIRRARPGAVLQCPVDFLGPVLLGAPATARDVLAMLRRCGVNRFSLNWQQDSVRRLFEQLDEAGNEVNLRGVPDLRGFLEAALLLPRSLTGRFDFPQWWSPQPPDTTHEPIRPALART
jgi:hypothetical protein